MDRVREEMQFIRDELDGFERFEERVEPLSSVPQAQSGTPMGGGVLTAPSSASPAQKLKHTYQSTVMAVPHYEAEYGDSFEESVRTEFDEPLCQVLLGRVTFTPLAKSRLIGASENARHNRSELLDDLERELAELRGAIDRFEKWITELERIRRRVTRWNDCEASIELARIERLNEECDALSSKRQRHLHRRSRTICHHREPDSFAQYLYQGTPFTMPILADISVVGERLDDERDRIRRRLTGGHNG
jgi:hypothetical protein